MLQATRFNRREQASESSAEVRCGGSAKISAVQLCSGMFSIELSSPYSKKPQDLHGSEGFGTLAHACSLFLGSGLRV